MSHQKLRVSIIGTGNHIGISRAHLMGYRYCPEDVEITGLYDLDKSAALAWKREFGLENAVCFDDLDQVLRHSDAVSICTPNFTHVDLICRCLQNDVQVLCEKPLSNTLEELKKLDPYLATTGVKGMINLNYRRIPAFRYLQRLVADGEMGRVYLYRHTMGSSRFANEDLPMEWRLREKQSGPGVIGDFCSHMLDMVHFILGIQDESLSRLATRKDTFIRERQGKNGLEAVDNEDCAMVIGVLPDGGLLNFMVSRVGAIGNRMEIIGSKAIARFTMEEPTKLRLQRREPGKVFGPEEEIDIPVENRDWYAADIAPEFVACAENVREFVKAIRNDTPVPTDLRHGARIQTEIDTILKASDEG